jgi:hypothetical protein
MIIVGGNEYEPEEQFWGNFYHISTLQLIAKVKINSPMRILPLRNRYVR